MEATFSMVVGMPRHETSIKPTLAIRCLMDCHGNTMDCDHPVYGKEQNIGLHGVIHPTAMSRVTVKETYAIDMDTKQPSKWITPTAPSAGIHAPHTGSLTTMSGCISGASCFVGGPGASTCVCWLKTCWTIAGTNTA